MAWFVSKNQIMKEPFSFQEYNKWICYFQNSNDEIVYFIGLQ